MSGPAVPDKGAWIRAAVDQFEGRLLRYAAQITGDVEQGRDVVQETFLKLCREDPAHLDGRLVAWLFAVCRNQALDVRRKERRMTTVARPTDQPGREPPQDQAVQQQETSDHVLAAIDRLPENQREVVQLKYQSGLSYREISEVTELSVSNVGYLLHTALNQLRRELNVQSG